MAQQLGLYQDQRHSQSGTHSRRYPPPSLPQARVRLCAACRASEARYGFRESAEGNPLVDRPRTLCFECFRVEITRRQAVAARLARGWNATQTDLPLSDTLDRLDWRRRRAQIAARHALGL